MKRTIVAAAVMSGLTLGTAATAHPGGPGHRHVAVVPAPHLFVRPAPGVVRPAFAYCATYGCSGAVTTTGPHGNTVTRSGNASCTDGTCTRSSTVTGPNGRTATFDRSISR
ncbi:MAG: hypothetical protein AAFR71_00775 [Pseudomonadota bacterium]